MWDSGSVLGKYNLAEAKDFFKHLDHRQNEQAAKLEFVSIETYC